MAITANGQQQPKRWTSRSESENAAFGFMGVTSCSFLCGCASWGERGAGSRRIGGWRCGGGWPGRGGLRGGLSLGRGGGRREAQGAEAEGVG